MVLLLPLAACSMEEVQQEEAVEEVTAPAFNAEVEVARWVELWGTYDLDTNKELFVQDDRLTYFSSEREGLIIGPTELDEHYAGFGFVPGGVVPEQKIWVQDIHSTDVGGAFVVGAVWFFGDPENPADAGRGPMTIVYTFDGDAYRIAHMHFANY